MDRVFSEYNLFGFFERSEFVPVAFTTSKDCAKKFYEQTKAHNLVNISFSYKDLQSCNDAYNFVIVEVCLDYTALSAARSINASALIAHPNRYGEGSYCTNYFSGIKKLREAEKTHFVQRGAIHKYRYYLVPIWREYFSDAFCLKRNELPRTKIVR